MKECWGALVLLLMHSMAPVTSAETTPGTVRLVGGEGACEGRVEIYQDGKWGTVCDDHWELKEAEVVCRQQGCGSAKKAHLLAHFGKGSGDIWLHNVECAGTESSLSSCRSGVGDHSCDHSRDAGVSCNDPITAGTVRLMGGEGACEGRVEIYQDGKWGTVCDDHWELKEAEVVCRQQGCGSAEKAHLLAHFGKGSGDIWLHNVECAGTESSLSGCRSGVGDHSCDHSRDAGVSCKDPAKPDPITAGTVRLVGGEGACEGRVEIYQDGKWGTVCDDHWELKEAEVVCRQQGCGSAEKAHLLAHFGKGSGDIWLHNVECAGTESSLSGCRHGVGSHSCDHSRDAGVSCKDPAKPDPITAGTVRLVGGEGACEGRVEIYQDGKWGTVCDDHWELKEAEVVCRQQGCGSAEKAHLLAHFGKGSGDIWLHNVECAGTESSLSGCRHGVGSHSCDHSRDAGVSCKDPAKPDPITAGTVRLLGGEGACEGRVEIYQDGKWGTVCDDHWELKEAEVVCRQQGCGSAKKAHLLAHFGKGSGDIWLHNVECAGTESSLSSCRHGVGSHSCDHSRDAGVSCNDPAKPDPITPGTVRLLGGEGACEGRVEIYQDGKWGTVCDDHWELKEAEVVCRQQGCGSAKKAHLLAHFGKGSGDIWLHNVECAGTESSLSSCRSGVGDHSCDHSRDAGVSCNDPIIPGTVRLKDGSNGCQGRVEIFLNGQWGTVCDDSWSMEDAQVVCRQLGCGPAIKAPISMWYGMGSGYIWLDEVHCQGTESSLMECKKQLGENDCKHTEDASVICHDEPTLGITELKLVDGKNRCEGRVEVSVSGLWGTVCGDNWGLEEAMVICRQLSCGKAVAAPINAHFGEGKGQIWMNKVECVGEESCLGKCKSLASKEHGCTHSEDAGVICEAKPTLSSTLRLVGGTKECEGRVEIPYGDTWGTVCDDHWGMNEAAVVCRQLGCGDAREAPISAYFGQGTGVILLDNVECTGAESSLTQCKHPTVGYHNCKHSEDASVVCEPKPTLGSKVKLVGGSNECEGRVELQNGGTWGVVCGDSWRLEEAAVVCRQLGCGKATSTPPSTNYGQSTGSSVADNLECVGTETSLTQCKFTGAGNQKCKPGGDASVICEAKPTPVSKVRLVGGSNECEGRVELQNGDTWGTVCDDSWELEDAQVVCRQLGCGKAKEAPTEAKFGKGSGVIWLDNVECKGTETSLTQCKHRGIGNHNCIHDEDASVVCEAKPRPGSELRLVGGKNKCEGRVELHHKDTWGTICNSYWGPREIAVVCRQLGCGIAASSQTSAQFTQSTGSIVMDNIECSGKESSLTECKQTDDGKHTCNKGDDATVICEAPGANVRLFGGKNQCEGRVELQYGDTWGTVCNNYWGAKEAEVVCRQLGCGKATSAQTSTQFTQSTVSILLDNIECTGKESSLTQCKHTADGKHTCNKGDDATVICEAKPVPASNVRLVGGKNQCEGRVEIQHGDKWRSVCDDYWGAKEAAVVCRQVGCGQATSSQTSGKFGKGTESVMDNIECTGKESTLSQCKHTDDDKLTCKYGIEAGVICEVPGSNVRLVGGSNKCQGRVELQHWGTWGTVCNKDWGLEEATVVCQQLGCGKATSAQTSAQFTQSTGSIFLDNIECTGKESSLTQCKHTDDGKHTCNKGDDATVICEVPGSNVRLVGGSNKCEGRVELQHKDTWGTVCNKDWGLEEATVVCQQLGCGKATSAQTSTQFTQSTGSIVMDNIECTGKESSLTQCKHTDDGKHTCNKGDDATVICEALGSNVRLVGGSNKCEGRVELQHWGTWGTVCNKDWGLEEAAVVCQQLGCGKATSAQTSTQFTQSTGSIVMDNIECTGKESSLTQCKHTADGKHTCNKGDDASVICEALGSEVRLVGGSNKCQGRVELQHKDTWGTVCNKDWGLEEATVVCQQLGCGKATSAQTSAQFTQSLGSILLDNIECTGKESSLTQCKHTDDGKHTCNKGDDATVICEVRGSNVRLVGGSNKCQGRVELQHWDTWGTVCNKDWGLEEATVVCQQLGCGKATSAQTSAQFTQSLGSIFLDNIECTGKESSLTQCKHTDDGKHTCNKGDDATVICEVRGSNVRLVGGSSKCEGRVELQHWDTWGTVCNKDWGLEEATVVCQQLGCGKATSAQTSTQFTQSTGSIFLDNIECTGKESSLTQCKHTDDGKHTCNKGDDASVICEAKPGPKVRLVGGTHKCEGRVELQDGSTWGTVCDDYWGLEEAQVVCRQLGCGKAKLANTEGRFGPGTGLILLDDLQCKGTESSLTECEHAGFKTHNCGHREDAGVVCGVELNPDAKPRLVGGTHYCEGRVELQYGESWGTVCNKDWGPEEAAVVCRQLGCGEAVTPNNGAFGPGTGLILLDKLYCKGTESSLTACEHSGTENPSCLHTEDAGITCAIKLSPDAKVRLVGGTHQCEGRVELQYGESWGTICNDYWGPEDAAVVCRQLGCGEPITPNTEMFGPGTGAILLDNLNCKGTESFITACEHSGAGKHNCRHKEDAGIICGPKLDTNAKVRLVGGTHHCEGRVELQYGSSWGTVCNDYWGVEEAAVVCRQLGCGEATNVNTEMFGPGTGLIVLDNLNCKGTESFLTTCEHAGDGNHNCRHKEDAGIICGVKLDKNANVRLVGGTHQCEGRVEVQFGSSWGTVCNDYWGQEDANVVCRQLGCGEATTPKTVAFGPGTGVILLDNLNCKGTESYLTECVHAGAGKHNCRHTEDAGIVCGIKLTTNVKLVGGKNPCEGRVEIQYGVSWGTVCNDYWGPEEAQVLCRQLGCGEPATTKSDARFGPGTGLIALDNVHCKGTESSLTECEHTGVGIHNCRHTEDVGIICGALKISRR